MKLWNKEQSFYRSIVQDAELYITGLTDAAGNFMHLEPRKTGKIGFNLNHYDLCDLRSPAVVVF